MENNIFCLCVNEQYGLPFDEQIRLMKDSGFNAFFTPWKYGFDTAHYALLAQETGMIYQSIHAPFGKAADMWHGSSEEQEIAVRELIDCVHDCADNGVKIMISHAFIGFDRDYAPNSQGLKNYGKVVDAAEKFGVKIAFENTEGLVYLASILDEFSSSESVGFCLDTGHEICYNYSENLLERWGERLIATHINDNLGIRDPKGKITWHDDLHLIPYDGIRDWDETAKRFDDCNYRGILTFELNTKSKPGRHENDVYEKMPLEQYFARAYAAACKFASKRKIGCNIL